VDLGLRGRSVLVCGASRGIGFAAAAEFVREGASVTICSRSGDALDDAARRLSHLGGEIRTVAADLATEAGIRTVIDDQAGRAVDVLVTNTAGPPTSTVLEPDWSAWQRTFELLFRSAVELSRALVPGMRARGWGRVVGVTSLAVRRPEPALVLTNSARSAVTAFFRTLAEEVGADGVTVNTVLPGYTETERLQSLARATATRTGVSADAVFEQWRAQTPLRRLGRPEEVGAAIAFLASDRAGFITGQALLVDGGVVRTLL